MPETRKTVINIFILLAFVSLLSQAGCFHVEKRRDAVSLSGPVIIDHRCTNINKIPNAYIEKAKNQVNFYYAHTSHGEQPVVGLELIMQKRAEYSVAIDRIRLPMVTNAVSILDHPYVAPEGFWSSFKGRSDVESILESNRSINLCMWAWCGQLGSYSAYQVHEYVETIAKFEQKYPDVTFVYMTGHAQYDGEKGYNRYMNNNIIRSWVKDHPGKNRVLFDFEDLDSWWKNSQTDKWEQATYKYWNGKEEVEVPLEHPVFRGDQQSHTTYESCHQKGLAAWWMFSVLAGWQPQ